MRGAGFAILVAVIVVGFVLSQALFAVDERQHALVLQLGAPVRSISNAGLNAKIPFVQSVEYFERRVMVFDAAPSELITVEKKQLLVDSYAFWRIVDVLKFRETVSSLPRAQARLNDIIASELRQEIAKDDFDDVISQNRESIMQTVAEASDERARELGIEVLDVRIKRVDLPAVVSNSVYSRMKAERDRIAKRHRSEGEEQAFIIRSQADKERTIILADAEREAQILRGEGDAEAIQIYADAYERDPEFYSFVRSLEAYQKALADDATVILGADSDLLQYLSSPTSTKNQE